MIVIACMTFLSCSNGNDDLTRTHIFKVVPPADSGQSNTIEISGKDQICDFKVLSTSDWSAKITESEGFSLSTESGASGNTTVAVSATMNNSGASRSATVSFIFNDEIRYEYTITQAEVEPFFDITPAFVPLTGDLNEFTLAVSTNQTSWTYEISNNEDKWITEKSKEGNTITFIANENNTDKTRSADIKFYSTLHPEVFSYITVQQAFLVDAPTADLLDVVFGPNGSAKDVSPMGMNVELRADETVSTTYLDKYGRYAGVFSKAGSPLSGQTTGYYTVPYTDNATFKSKLEDGFTIEMLIRRYDEPGTKQIKPFASTQAGGTGICFRAKEGNEFNFEVHTGGAWRNVYSGITPQKDIYYHAIAVWDKENAVAKLYVDGVLTGTTTAAGDFKFMTTNVNAYWFGIGADPNPNNLGEATFNGEVVIARLYGDPLTNEQVQSLWKLVQ